MVFRGSFPSPIEVIQRGQTPYSRQAVFWSPHPSHPYCITTWVICQEVFYIFFGRLLGGVALGDFHSVVALSLLPLTTIVYHRPHQKSIGNIAQIWEFVGRLFCTIFLLTKCQDFDIMEISPAALVSGRLKKEDDYSSSFSRAKIALKCFRTSARFSSSS